MANIEDIKKILEDNHLRVTQQRIEVLYELSNTYLHPTAEDIFEKLSKRFSSLSLATVYKTLDTFANHGIIRKIKNADQSIHYDADLSPHYHLLCSKTNKIIDFRDDEFLILVNHYFINKNITNFKVSEIQLNILGETIN